MSMRSSHERHDNHRHAIHLQEEELKIRMRHHDDYIKLFNNVVAHLAPVIAAITQIVETNNSVACAIDRLTETLKGEVNK